MHRRILRAVDAFPMRVLAFTLLVLALVSTGYVWYSTAQDAADRARFESFVECQARWSNDLREYAEATARASADERAVDRLETTAINRLVRELVDNEVENEVAIERWRESLATAAERRREIEVEREANPLPAPPIEVCNHVDEVSTPQEGSS